MSRPAGRDAKDEPVNAGIPPAKTRNRPRRKPQSSGLDKPCPHSRHGHRNNNPARASGKTRHPESFQLALE